MSRLTPIRRHAVRLAFCLSCAVLSPSISDTPGLEAQEAIPQTATGTADSVPVPRPIATADFASQEDDIRARIRAAQSLLLPDAAVQNVTDQLSELTELLEELSQSPETLRPDRYPLRRIENLRSEWAVFHGRIDRWRGVVRERIAALERADSGLVTLRARAVVTDSAIAARGGSDLLQLRIADLVDDIDDVRNELRGAIEGTLAIQDRLLAEQAHISDQLAAFDAQFRSMQRQLLVVESPPLWVALSGRSLASPAPERGDSFQGAVDALAQFGRDRRPRLLFQLAFFAFMSAGLMIFGRRARSWGQADALRGPLHLLEHPVATSAITALLLTMVLYTAPPVEAGEIALLLSVPPVVLLLRGLVGESLRPALYLLSGMLVLDVLTVNLDWMPVLGRLLLFAETLLGAAGMIWLVRNGAARQPPTSRWWYAALFGARIATAALIVSALANIVGNRSLSEFLTSGVVRSSYLAVLMVSGSLIGKGLVTLIPRMRLGEVLRGVRRHADLVVRRLQRPVDLLAFLTWLWLTARIFSLADLFVASAADTLGYVWSVGSVQVSLGGILLFVFTIWLSFKVSQLTRFFLAEEVLDRLDLPRGVPGTISTMTHYTILFGGLFLALAVAGIDLSRLTLVAGALGVGIGFGLQGLVNNFVSGLILIFERPISLGDTVEVGTLIGRVQRIGMRSTTVLTFDGAEVIVPNGNLIANDVTNWTLSDQKRRVEVRVGAAYGTDPEQVRALLLEAAREQDEVLTYPEPMALFSGFGDSSLDFVLRAWVRTFEDHFRIRSELTSAVYAAFQRGGIQIPFPQRDLYVKTVPEGFLGPEIQGAEADATAPGDGGKGSVDASPGATIPEGVRPDPGRD